MISILANVARHVDFMATSIKYLSMEAHFQEQDIFAVLNGSHKRFFFSTLFHFFFIFQGWLLDFGLFQQGQRSFNKLFRIGCSIEAAVHLCRQGIHNL